MKYLIISDIHGSKYYVEKVLEVYQNENCDKMIILGDVLYHGPRNDLPEGYNPKEVVRLLNQYKDDIMCIKGNCDAEVDEMVLDFELHREYFLNTEHFKIYLNHGHGVEIHKLDPSLDINLILYGHTHIHKIEISNKLCLINPGSISIPKGDMINSFAIMEDNSVRIYDFYMNMLKEYVKEG